MKRRLKEQPKERILHSAKKEFSEYGFSGARMSNIAKRASVNKALIHYYFTDKDTLYLEVLTRIFTGAGGSSPIPEFIGKWDLTPPQKLYVLIYFIVNIFLKAMDPDALRIMFWELAEGGRYVEQLTMEYDVPRQQMFASIVREGIESGEFEAKYPHLSVMNIISFVSFYSINKEIYKGKSVFKEIYGGADEKDIFEYVLDLVFKSLKPKQRKLEIPNIPADLKLVLEELIKVLIDKKDEWANEEVLRRFDLILQH